MRLHKAQHILANHAGASLAQNIFSLIDFEAVLKQFLHGRLFALAAGRIYKDNKSLELVVIV